jgi:hypothetical protein
MQKRFFAVWFTLITLFLCPLARADDKSLLGTWQLKSFVREVSGTGERYNQLGEHPNGYLSYSADGRMLVLFVSSDQPRPRQEPSDEERIKLHKSMLSYGDTLSLKTEPNKSPVDGREGVGILTFERVKAQQQ